MNETLRNLKEQLREEYKGKCRAAEVRNLKEQIKHHEEQLKENKVIEQ